MPASSAFEQFAENKDNRCFASRRILHSDGHHQRMSASVVAPPCNEHANPTPQRHCVRRCDEESSKLNLTLSPHGWEFQGSPPNMRTIRLLLNRRRPSGHLSPLWANPEGRGDAVCLAPRQNRRCHHHSRVIDVNSLSRSRTRDCCSPRVSSVNISRLSFHAKSMTSA